MISKIHHVGIVVEKLDHAYTFWRDTLGLPLLREAEIPDQGVRAALLAAGDSEVELLEPIRSDSGVARFLASEGGYETAMDAAKQMTDLALMSLRAADPQGEAGEALSELADKLLQRNQ